MQGHAKDTALIFAAAEGNGALCDELLRAGANPNAVNTYGNTPLIMAVQSGDLPTVERLLITGLELESRNERGNTALLYAAYQGRTAIAERLIWAGADVDARNDHGSTPLIYAAYNGHLDLVRHLLDHGADIKAADDERRTALLWAAIRGKDRVVTMLRAAGAVDRADATGMTAIAWMELMRRPAPRRADLDQSLQMQVKVLSRTEAMTALPRLAELLQDAVDNGASVGYLAPLSATDAAAYWSPLIAGLEPAQRRLLVAMVDGVIAGTVQLVLETRPNGNHRAEVAKLLVHTEYRRRGVATALMAALEREARAAGRTLLVLDTQTGEPAEELYLALGYVRTGIVPGYRAQPRWTAGADVVHVQSAGIDQASGES